jgi:ankyrin repeat protein
MLFKGTKAWKLTKAVQKGDTESIKQIVKKSPKLLNYREPTYGNTLINMLILTESQNAIYGIDEPKVFETFKTLLELGADVSFHNKIGYSPMTFSCLIRSERVSAYIDELIKHGADINYPDSINAMPFDTNFFRSSETPLIRAAEFCNLEATKKLVECGALLDYADNEGRTALGAAVYGEFAETSMDIMLYLLQSGADYNKPVFYTEAPGNEPLHLVKLLRMLDYDLDDAAYLKKRMVIKFLDEHGIHYDDTPIPDEVLEHIKETYPNTWEYYITKY